MATAIVGAEHRSATPAGQAQIEADIEALAERLLGNAELLARAALAAGNVQTYPSGTRNADEALGEFYTCVEDLYREADVRLAQ